MLQQSVQLNIQLAQQPNYVRQFSWKFRLAKTNNDLVAGLILSLEVVEQRSHLSLEALVRIGISKERLIVLYIFELWARSWRLWFVHPSWIPRTLGSKPDECHGHAPVDLKISYGFDGALAYAFGLGQDVILDQSRGMISGASALELPYYGA